MGSNVKARCSWAALTVAVGLVGACAQGGKATSTDFSPVQPAPEEMEDVLNGGEPEAEMERPAQPVPAVPDAEPSKHRPWAQPASGGGTGESARYQVQLRVSAPQPYARGVGMTHRAAVGGLGQ